MRSSRPGTDTSRAEVSHIDGFGIWILLMDREYFLPYEGFPWFRDATVREIVSVETLNEDHLYWPELDVDLSVESLGEPESFPLIYR